MMKQLILTLFIFAGLITGLKAQWFVTTDQVSMTSETMQSALAKCVYLDAEEKICFLDLEKVPLNLKQAVLINEAGDEVINKALEEIPVNSIVELDYNDLPSGAYILELRSYRGKVQKALRL